MRLTQSPLSVLVCVLAFVSLASPGIIKADLSDAVSELKDLLWQAQADPNQAVSSLKKGIETLKSTVGSLKSSVGPVLVPALLQHISRSEGLGGAVAESLGVRDEFMKPVVRIFEAMTKLGDKSDSELKFSSKVIKKHKSGGKDDEDGVITNTILADDEQGGENVGLNQEFLDLTKSIFQEEFGSQGDLVLTPPAETTSKHQNGTTDLWMMVKSTWQRILAFVQEENSLQNFMQRTPVKIIDRILNLGDEFNLMGFLAKKLDPKLAYFLTEQVDPYLGPLRDFESFYNFTREYGLSGSFDYFSSPRVTNTVQTLASIVTAYLEDKISSDVINQYIDFISFDNVELRNFYRSLLKAGEDDGSPETPLGNSTHRYRRDILDHIVSTFKAKDFQNDEIPSDIQAVYGGKDDENVYKNYRATERRLEAGEQETNDQDSEESADMDMPEQRQILISRDGGYGGSGYGGYGGGYTVGYMSTLDPYVVLGAVALGTLLGFLLFRLINGTRNGRRDLQDGSLSLWLSDIPHQGIPSWLTSVERVKRETSDNDEEGINLPEELRGDVWSSDPLVTSDVFEDDLKEEDLADHLNHLWEVYEDTESPACVHSHLCGVVANSTAEDLTGKYSSIAILMSSVGSMMGVVRPGQLVDHVTHSLVMGHPYTCPSLPFSCHGPGM